MFDISSTMSDNEYEKFEISDYDLENEFNPFRPGRRRPTKNQQIYGTISDILIFLIALLIFIELKWFIIMLYRGMGGR